jgi:DNA polymerase III subunit chi
MTRVDFYLAQDANPRAAPVLACRLAEKAWKLGHKVYVHARDAADAQRLDELMWTFRDVSFVPHALAGSGDEADVVIGHDGPPAGFAELLVNLGGDAAPYAAHFARVAEVVAADEDERTVARERFRAYRERGFELETHEV